MIVTEDQVKFGELIGLDLKVKSIGVAKAMIDDAIDYQFYQFNDLKQPTLKQIELAQKFGHDISIVSRRVGDAIINDLMTQLNHSSINKHRLERDVVVTNIHDPINQKFVISSIKEDGTVFFRGGNGSKAWARSLVRADN